MRINNKIGSPVEGNDFFGRDKDISRAWEIIRDGNSLILAAPRRIGKSSFAKRMIREAKEEKWKTLYLDLQGVKTEEDFVKLFIEKIQNESWFEKSREKVTEILTDIANSLKVTASYAGAGVSIEWKKGKTDVFEKLKKVLDHSENTLIVVDELAVFLTQLLETGDGKNDVEFFLNWLRSFRQAEGNRIFWIFCSSIGIKNFTNKHRLTYTLNDAMEFKLDEYLEEDAKGLLYGLYRGANVKGFNDEHIEYVLHKLGWKLPYFIQLIFSEIVTVSRELNKPVDQEVIDKAYVNLISKQVMNSWEERLDEYEDLRPHAIALLNRLSEISEGETRVTLRDVLYARINDADRTVEILARLLDILQNDGYLIRIDERFAFRSPLVRDFWYNKFVG